MTIREVRPGEGILRGADRDRRTGDTTVTVGRCQQIRCLEEMIPIRKWRKGGITDTITDTTTVIGMGRVEVAVEVAVAVIITKPKRTKRSVGDMSYILKR